jgi:hypothetical protein
MSEYTYTCPCCYRVYNCTSTRPMPTQKERCRMVCKQCLDAVRQMSKTHVHDGAKWVPKGVAHAAD